MKILFKKRSHLLSFVFGTLLVCGLSGFFLLHKKTKPHSRPQLTMVFVIDQFAYHYLYKIKPFLTGGIKTLLDNGILYTHATHPHGVPTTACGHAAIGSGAYAKHHGIIGNEWANNEGKAIASVDDSPENAAIFKPLGGTYTDRGASSKNLMVDNLSDSFALTGLTNTQKNMVFSFSFKDRSAIMMGGKMGKTFWFDEQGNGLTSSKAYFDKLPAWVIEFNKKNAPPVGQELLWEPIHKLTSEAYNFSQKDNYAHCALGPLCNTKICIQNTELCGPQATHELFEKTPHADAFIVKAVKECLTKNFSGKPDEACLLWLSFSCLDLAGHYYGPHSIEAIDMVYQIDQRIKDLMDFVKKTYPNINPIFALTADHGVMPIPEVLQDEGFSLPVRVNVTGLVKQLNDIAKQEFGVENIISVVKPPQFFFNRKLFKSLSTEKKHALTERLANILREHPSIKQVWTKYELEKATSTSDIYAELFCNQYYKGRSPHLTCLAAPYHMITKHDKGTSHDTPYLYDIHVPLVLWQKGLVEKKTISEPVKILQLPVTLAHLLNIQCPSADEKEMLPGIVTK